MQARHVMPPERILVEVDGAEVALTGRAASWNERNAAGKAAWAYHPTQPWSTTSLTCTRNKNPHRAALGCPESGTGVRSSRAHARIEVLLGKDSVDELLERN